METKGLNVVNTTSANQAGPTKGTSFLLEADEKYEHDMPCFNGDEEECSSICLEDGEEPYRWDYYSHFEVVVTIFRTGQDVYGAYGETVKVHCEVKAVSWFSACSVAERVEKHFHGVQGLTKVVSQRNTCEGWWYPCIKGETQATGDGIVGTAEVEVVSVLREYY